MTNRGASSWVKRRYIMSIVGKAREENGGRNRFQVCVSKVRREAMEDVRREARGDGRRKAGGDGGSFFSSVSFVWFVSCVLLIGRSNQINQTNQVNQINESVA